MKYHYFLVLVFFILSYSEQCAAYNRHLPAIKPFECRERQNTTNSLYWIRLKDGQQCVQIINDINLPKCMFDQFTKANLTYQTKSSEYLINQNIAIGMRKLNCDTFLLFTQNLSFIIGVFRDNQKHFRPFSYVYLLKPNNMTVPQTSLNIAFDKGYNLFELESEIFDDDSTNVSLSYKRVTNSLSNASIEISGTNDVEIERFFGEPLFSHPLFNPEFSKKRKPFRINLFDCPPYVIMLDQKKLLFSGVEYLFVHDVVKTWNREIKITDAFWSGIITNLINNTVDVGLCSIWLSQLHLSQFDLSTYFDFQCTTLLVPKPVPINEATFIYKSLSAPVWIYFGIVFIGMGLLLTCFTKLGLRLGLYRNLHGNSIFETFTRSYLEIINTITSHGVYIFPQCISFRFIILSLVSLCFIFDAIYSCGYVSLMTSAPLTKPIDSIEEFVEQGLKWGVLGNTRTTKADQLGHGVPIFTKAAERIVPESSVEERVQNIYSGKFAYFVKILSNKFITEFPTNSTNTSLPLRVMKNCMIHYYTTLGFPKQSPYRDYFSEKLASYQATGILRYWFDSITRDNYNFMKNFMDVKREDREPSVLKLCNISGAIYLLLVGLSISILTFLCEIIPWRRVISTCRKNIT